MTTAQIDHIGLEIQLRIQLEIQRFLQQSQTSIEAHNQ